MSPASLSGGAYPWYRLFVIPPRNRLAARYRCVGLTWLLPADLVALFDMSRLSLSGGLFDRFVKSGRGAHFDCLIRFCRLPQSYTLSFAVPCEDHLPSWAAIGHEFQDAGRDTGGPAVFRWGLTRHGISDPNAPSRAFVRAMPPWLEVSARALQAAIDYLEDETGEQPTPVSLMP